MSSAPNPDAAEDAARRVLDARIAAVRTLVSTRALLESAREALAAAEQTDAAAYTDATRAGWTENELKQVGFPPPGRRPPGRPRRPSRTPASGENGG